MTAGRPSPTASATPTETKRVKAVAINPEDPELTIADRERLLSEVESLPVVTEMHQMGLALENLIKTYAPDTKPFPFGFDSTPPWDLEKKCMDLVGSWWTANGQTFMGVAAPKPAVPGPASPAPATPASTAAPAKPAPVAP
jgi:hypothetical protein